MGMVRLVNFCGYMRGIKEEGMGKREWGWGNKEKEEKKKKREKEKREKEKRDEG